jgi:predicted PurR-regulated permease PerM
MNPFFKSSEHQVDINPWSIVFAVFFVIGLYIVFLIKNILLLFFLAFIIMVALNPLVSGAEKKLKLNRTLSAAIVYILVLIVLVGLVSLVVPPVIRDMYQLVKDIEFPALQEQLSELRFTISEATALIERVGGSVGLVFSIITSTFLGIFTFVTLLVMSFFLMLDRPHLHRKLMWFTKDVKHIERFREFIDEVESQLGGWVRGQSILMVLIGFVTYIGLALIGVPYALPLAVLAGSLEILPNLGPTISAIPGIALAYLNLGPVMAGVTAVFYIVVQQLENNVIVPKIMKDNADVNPLVAIMVILIGAQLGGVVGALLSVPAYIILRTVYSFYRRQ